MRTIAIIIMKFKKKCFCCTAEGGGERSNLGTNEDDGVPTDQVPHPPQEAAGNIQQVHQQHHQRFPLPYLCQLHAQLIWQHQARASADLAITWNPQVLDTRHHGPVAQVLASPASHGPPVSPTLVSHQPAFSTWFVHGQE